MDAATQTTIITSSDGETISLYSTQNREKAKDNYWKNVDAKREYQREYNVINHDKYTEYQKSYYDLNKEKILNAKKEKIVCECGKCVTVGNLTSHKNTNLHFKHLLLKQSQHQTIATNNA